MPLCIHLTDADYLPSKGARLLNTSWFYLLVVLETYEITLPPSLNSLRYFRTQSAWLPAVHQLSMPRVDTRLGLLRQTRKYINTFRQTLSKSISPSFTPLILSVYNSKQLSNVTKLKRGEKADIIINNTSNRGYCGSEVLRDLWALLANLMQPPGAHAPRPTNHSYDVAWIIFHTYLFQLSLLMPRNPFLRKSSREKGRHPDACVIQFYRRDLIALTNLGFTSSTTEMRVTTSTAPVFHLKTWYSSWFYSGHVIITMARIAKRTFYVELLYLFPH